MSGRGGWSSRMGPRSPDSASLSNRSGMERRPRSTIPAQVTPPAPLPLLRSPLSSSPTLQPPLTDGHFFAVIDPVKAAETRPSGLQKDSIQKEELATQEPQWRYQLPTPGTLSQAGSCRLELWTMGFSGRWVTNPGPLHPQSAKQGDARVPGKWPAASPSAPGERLLPKGNRWGERSGSNTRGNPPICRGRSLPQESSGAAPTGHR